MRLEFMHWIRPRLLIAGAVAAGHVALLGQLAFVAPREAAGNGAPEFLAIAQIIVQAPHWDKVPLPQVDFDTVPVDTDALKLVQFDDAGEDPLAGVIGPASAPRLARFQYVDVRDFAQRAGVRPGHPVTVVLSVQVTPDGAANSVDVVRSSGSATADAAAIDYALSLRWIPGTVDRNPRAMRVMLPVTLAAPPPRTNSG